MLAAMEAQHQLAGGLVAVVIGQHVPILQRFAGTDDALLVKRNACQTTV